MTRCARRSRPRESRSCSRRRLTAVERPAADGPVRVSMLGRRHRASSRDELLVAAGRVPATTDARARHGRAGARPAGGRRRPAAGRRRRRAAGSTRSATSTGSRRSRTWASTRRGSPATSSWARTPGTGPADVRCPGSPSPTPRSARSASRRRRRRRAAATDVRVVTYGTGDVAGAYTSGKASAARPARRRHGAERGRRRHLHRPGHPGAAALGDDRDRGRGAARRPVARGPVLPDGQRGLAAAARELRPVGGCHARRVLRQPAAGRRGGGRRAAGPRLRAEAAPARGRARAGRRHRARTVRPGLAGGRPARAGPQRDRAGVPAVPLRAGDRRAAAARCAAPGCSARLPGDPGPGCAVRHRPSMLPVGCGHP